MWPNRIVIGSDLPDQVFNHVYLCMLHKPELSKETIQLPGGEAQPKQKIDLVPNKIPNKVFLYNVSRPFDENLTRNLNLSPCATRIYAGRPYSCVCLRLSCHDICEDKFAKLLCSELMESGCYGVLTRAVGRDSSDLVRRSLCPLGRGASVGIDGRFQFFY
jgi:hypothetical protein